MVEGKDGELYHASNCKTKALTKERHYADCGLPWKEAEKKGDRLVRVMILTMREKPKKKQKKK